MVRVASVFVFHFIHLSITAFFARLLLTVLRLPVSAGGRLRRWLLPSYSLRFLPFSLISSTRVRAVACFSPERVHGIALCMVISVMDLAGRQGLQAEC